MEQIGKHSNNFVFMLLLKYASGVPLVSILICFFTKMYICVCVFFAVGVSVDIRRRDELLGGTIAGWV